MYDQYNVNTEDSAAFKSELGFMYILFPMITVLLYLLYFSLSFQFKFLS